MADASPRDSGKALTYASYLRIDELLSLQTPESEEHDEILFIVIHQVYELWFKEILHELDRLVGLLGDGATPDALHTLKRVLTILKIAVAQLDVLETMTPLEFLSFRDRLASASGFQSAQFRELEFALGRKRRGMLEHFPDDTPWRERLERRWTAPTVWDALLRYLEGRGHAVPAAALERDVTRQVEASEDVQATLLETYRNDPLAAQVCGRMVDRGDPGVALPARQDGPAHHRRPEGNRRLGGRGVPQIDALRAAVSRPVGDPLVVLIPADRPPTVPAPSRSH